VVETTSELETCDLDHHIIYQCRKHRQKIVLICVASLWSRKLTKITTARPEVAEVLHTSQVSCPMHVDLICRRRLNCCLIRSSTILTLLNNSEWSPNLFSSMHACFIKLYQTLKVEAWDPSCSADWFKMLCKLAVRLVPRPLMKKLTTTDDSQLLGFPRACWRICVNNFLTTT
jgi:hypothetical protein